MRRHTGPAGFVGRIGRARLAACALLAAAMLGSGAAPARADIARSAADGYGSLRPLGEGELGALRGGFVGPDGLDIGIVANVRTMVDGQPVLESVLVPDANGVLAAVPASGEPLPALPPGAVRLVRGEPQGQGPGGLAGGSGLLIDDARGFTAIMHQLPSGALANVILNEAAGRTVSQHVEVVVTVSNFTDVQPRLQRLELGGALGRTVQQGLAAALR